MRPSLLLCTLLLSLGCARSVEPMGRARDAAPAEDSATPAGGAGADDAGHHEETRDPGPPAEPADQRAHASGAPTQAAPRDAGPPVEPPGAAAECRSDADCSITLVPEGGCCPRLCLGRAVPATESLKLDERQRACEERGGPCPDPVCARPRHRPVAVCTGGRCATRMMPMEER